MVSPGGELSRPGLSSNSAKGPVSRILSRACSRWVNRPYCGHSSRRRVAAGAHQRPTRRFRQQPRAAFARRANAPREPGSWPASPSLFGLAPCGVYPASVITAGAVRSYRTFSPLPLHGAVFWTSSVQWRYVFCGTGRPWVLRPTSRMLSGTLPCGVRTFLSRRLERPPAATARSSCQTLV